MYRDLEARVREIGSRIHALMGEEVPALFDLNGLQGRIMEWAMKEEAVKVSLFRFIDVLPALKSDELVVRMLNEYFADIPGNPLLHGIGRVSGMLPSVAGRAVRRSVESLAGQFIAGKNERDALSALAKLRSAGAAFTVDLLGEEVLSENEAADYARRYTELIRFLGPEVNRWAANPMLDNDQRGAIPRLDVSLKVSSFYSQIDPIAWDDSVDRTSSALDGVLESITATGASFTTDMEQYNLKDLTIAIFRLLVERHPEAEYPAMALQAYLKECKADVLELIGLAKKIGRPLGIRLVKGAYWDHETIVNRLKGLPVPVFTDKEETDANYEELTRLILENAAHVRPALAGHNVRSISHGLAVAETLGLPKEAVEFQMIYGMAEPVRAAVQRMGYRVRTYAPVGEMIPGMAYLIRRLLENTSNESFLRKSFSGGASFEELIRSPDPKPEPPAFVASADDFANEPCPDFSRPANREAIVTARARVEKEFGSTFPLFIGGRPVHKDRHIVSVNPSRPSQVIGRVSSAERSDAERAVEYAHASAHVWAATGAENRAAYLFRAADVIRRRRFDLMALEVCEVGKTWEEAAGDVAEAVDYLEYYGREMIRLGKTRVLGNLPGEENRYLCEPRGVGVVISPWNFPLAIPAGMVSAAIVAGNCVILKPSGLSPVLGLKLMEVFQEVGLPPGVLQFCPGPGSEVGEFLVSHPGIDFIAFTGSREVGLRIVELAGKVSPGQRNVKRVIAEMGGKNAIIVDETADLDLAVSGVLRSALGFQGQKCSACSRVVVVGDVYDDFCNRLKDAMNSIHVGPAENPRSFMGPVVDEAAMKRIRAAVETGAASGTPILVRRTEEVEGYFVGPTLIGDVDPDSPLAQEEIFGPVIAAMRAADIDDALRIANATPYALTGGIFSRSPENLRKASPEFRVGNLYINRKITGAQVGRQPFGGFAMSGVGSKAGGPEYLLQFLQFKTISENTLRRGFAPPS